MTEKKTDKKNEVAQVTKQELAAKNITDAVLNKVVVMQETGGLVVPKDYSPENALKSAWLVLQNVKSSKQSGLRPALSYCTQSSIANSLLDMVVQGLNPAKHQCYFVVYDKELTLLRSYMGSVAVARRFAGVKDVFAQVVYKGDEFEYEIDPKTGIKQVTKHIQSLYNVDLTKIIAAYAVVMREEGDNYTEIMTFDQIKKAWNQGATKGSSGAHTNFAEEMSKKTVINRACKMFINTSSDAPILSEAYNRTTEADYEDSKRNGSDSEIVLDAEEVEAVEASRAIGFPQEAQNEPETGDGSQPEETPADNPDALTDEEKEAILAEERREAERKEMDRAVAKKKEAGNVSAV